jgi:hypothetical protein
VVEGYRRRRAWAAFYAGYGLHAKDAKIEHLLGTAAKRSPMPLEELMANLDRHMIAHNTRLAKLGEAAPH